MDSWDFLSCVLLQLLPPNTAHITPVLSTLSPGLQGRLLSPDIPEEQLHWRRQCQERAGKGLPWSLGLLNLHHGYPRVLSTHQDQAMVGINSRHTWPCSPNMQILLSSDHSGTTPFPPPPLASQTFWSVSQGNR